MTGPWEKFQKSGAPSAGPWTKYQGKTPVESEPEVAAPQSLQERARETFGFEDYEERGTILPVGFPKEGGVEFALPQFAVDMLTSALLPGHAYQGGAYSPEDVARFAMDFAVPATVGRRSGGAVRGRKALRQSAPTTDDLRVQAKAPLAAAQGSAVSVKPARYLDMLADIENLQVANKTNPTLHPKSAAVFQQLTKDIGKPMDVEDLMVARRLIGVAQRSTSPDLADDRRIANIMEDALDDFVDNLTSADVDSGDPYDLGANLAEFRRLWSRMKKSETIETLIYNAEHTASGFENGLRSEFRALLKNPKRMRGFTADERKIFEEIEQGTSKQKALRLLGKMSFGTRGGSNFLGGAIGMTAGANILGGAGAVVPPAVGYVAQKGADTNARNTAELARAMAATGGRMPSSGLGQHLGNILMRFAGPVAGTYIPEESGVFDPNL